LVGEKSHDRAVKVTFKSDLPENEARCLLDVCDALPDIGQALTDLLAIKWSEETPHQVLSPS